MPYYLQVERFWLIFTYAMKMRIMWKEEST